MTNLDSTRCFDGEAGTDDGQGNKTYSVTFCSGAPGTIPMLCTAVEVFSNNPTFVDRLLYCALKVGELTWQQGLILKGNGLCHGISGNGYLLHCLFRAYSRFAKTAKDKK